MRMTPSKDPDLPYDIVVDVLSRLGVKTLMRLRCVCKSWNSIITHPTFITMHLNRLSSYNNNNNGYLQYLNFSSYSRKLSWYLLCGQRYDHEVELEIPIKSYIPLFVGTFNGLACLLPNSREYSRYLCLWNPSIRKSKIVSVSSPFIHYPQHPIYRNNFALGFCFHSQTNDYKIVRILYCPYLNDPPPSVEVYSLNTDSWRKIEAFVPCYGPYPLSNAFFNGAFHWVARKSVAHPDHKYTVMSFDIGSELFGEMTLPNYAIDGVAIDGLAWEILSLAVLKESLSLCVCFEPSGHCDIWVMSEYGVVESWTKQFTIILPQAGIQRFLGILKNNVLLLQARSGLVSYDLESSQFENLGIPVSSRGSCVFPFMESLVLL